MRSLMGCWLVIGLKWLSPIRRGKEVRLLLFFNFLLTINGAQYGIGSEVMNTRGMPIRLNFLDTPELREDTIQRLIRAECSPAVMEAVERFIETEGRRLDWTDHAERHKHDGGFMFGSVDELMRIAPPEFPGFLNDSPKGKRHSLMCFDFAMFVLRDGPVGIGQAEQNLKSKYFVLPQTTTRGGLSRFAVATEQEGLFTMRSHLLSSEATYARLTGFDSRSQAETSLALSLRAARALPGHFANSELALRKLFAMRAELWRRDGVSFSSQIQIVLAHYVDFRNRFMGVDHIGLAVPGELGWMYLEKNGTTNPVIRIDFRSRDEITNYVARLFEADRYNPRSPLHHAAFLISFNNDLVWVRPREPSLLRVSDPM